MRVRLKRDLMKVLGREVGVGGWGAVRVLWLINGKLVSEESRRIILTFFLVHLILSQLESRGLAGIQNRRE